MSAIKILSVSIIVLLMGCDMVGWATGNAGGSNYSGDLIDNGGFENLDTAGLPSNWSVNKAVFSVDPNFTHTGGNSMHGIATSYLYELGPGPGSLHQTIFANRFTAGQIYTFSFWYNVGAFGGNSAVEVKLGSLNYTFITSANGVGWQKYSFDFTCPSLKSDVQLDILVNVAIPYKNEKWDISFDDFSLVKK